MSYVVLARKYRPQQFEDVVGQNPVSQTLLNALESGRVAHAYIFSGPRGVGKTTTARILAKCLNCEKGPTKTPCNKCVSCVAITQNNSVDDVLEIDGASNRGIEQIRDLRESAKYAPARSRYRIYIIDEAHQITKDAFGALLKTLEEPPDHVVFMMATTEVQKIPAPILSRCQRFMLRPISPDLVFKHLKEICKQEKIKVDEAALADIVRFVEGSLRDALSLLDQAIVFSPGGITAQSVRDLLGLLPLDVIRKFVMAIQSGEPTAILQDVNNAIQNGTDLTQLAKDTQGYYHKLLLAKAGVSDALDADADKNAQEAKKFSFEELERNIRLLARLQDEMRRSDTPRAVFEVYALKLGQKTLDPRGLIERLEKIHIQKPSPVTPSMTPPPTPQAPAPTYFAKKTYEAPKSAPTFTKAAPSTTNLPETTPAPEAPTASPTAVNTPAAWNEFVSHVAGIKESLATALQDCIADASNGRLLLKFTKAFHLDMVNRSTALLREPLQKFFAGMMLETRLDKPSTAKASEGRPEAPAKPAAADRGPATANDHLEEISAADAGAHVQEALKHFQGTVKREKKSS